MRSSLKKMYSRALFGMELGGEHPEQIMTKHNEEQRTVRNQTQALSDGKENHV
jgi:hypothetical protein